MGGIITKINGDMLHVNLHGRLGVLEVPRSLLKGSVPEEGMRVQFYFSYMQTTKSPLDYDTAALDPSLPLDPTLVGGKLITVNDTAVKTTITNIPGTIAVPRRWIFTDWPLEEGQYVEYYLSCLIKEESS